MVENTSFKLVGAGYRKTESIPRRTDKTHFPIVSVILLGILVLGCLLADVICDKNPGYLYLESCSVAPCREFLFGTDHLGRDIFSCVWHGGRISIVIGLLATAISTVLAIVYGAVSGVASDFVDTAMMRLTEIFLSIPSLLLTIFILAILGEPTVLSIAIVIGITSWCSIAKVVRTEVRQLRKSEYVIASRCMGGNFFFILRYHFLPNLVSPIMFMVIMNVRSAMVAEATLSFMGMGLPIETVSWGSLLSLANNAMLSKAWWVIVIPGLFMILLFVCLTNFGNMLRKQLNQKESNL